MILTLLWAALYTQSPYIFPAISTLLYAIGVDPTILVAFPLSYHYSVKELRTGKEITRKDLVYLETLRLIWVGFWYDYGVDLSLVMSGYCGIILLGIIMHHFKYETEYLLDVRFRLYLVWTVVLLLFHWLSPVIFITHFLNFAVEFRIPLESIRNV